MDVNKKYSFQQKIVTFGGGTGHFSLLRGLVDLNQPDFISAAVGTFFRNKLGDYAGLFGFAGIANYLHIFSWSFFRYMIHGIFEIASYFVGALAAGIISVAIVNHELNSKKFKYVFFDALYLIAIAIIVLIVAALIEVYITPIIF